MPADLNNDLLVVTSASGKQASHLLPLLYGKWKHIRLVVHSAGSEERLKQRFPDADITRADIADPHDTRRILKGATSLCHTGPIHPHETEIGYNLVDAAVEEASNGSFKHFVYSSVLNTQLRKLLNHDSKRYIEEYLIESGLQYTILQPTHLMQDHVAKAILSVKDNPVYRAIYNPNTSFSFMNLNDLGAAAETVLVQREKHYLAQYPLCSTRPMPYTELIDMLGNKIGKKIEIQRPGFEEATEMMLKVLLKDQPVPPKVRDVMERLLLYYNRRGLVGNPNVLEWLIGRPPTTVDDWLSAHVAAAAD